MTRPRTIALDPSQPDSSAFVAAIAEALEVLQRGDLVAIPTETVYGLAGRALDPAAIERIFAAKGRPRSHPLIAHVEDEASARALAASWSPAAAALAEAFFPGPLTLVVPRAEHVPLEIAAGGSTVAVRAPAHPVARALIRALGEPIAAPSANRYQSISPTRAEHVVQSLGDRVALVLDAGPTLHGIESTVVDLTSEAPRLLRPGSLPLARLMEVAPDLVVREGLVVDASEATRASPGLDARHYAPRARLEIATDAEAALERAAAIHEQGGRVIVLLRSEIVGSQPLYFQRVVLGDRPQAYGAALFAALHAADASGADVIVVESVPEDDAWMAIRDRLRRARA